MAAEQRAADAADTTAQHTHGHAHKARGAVLDGVGWLPPTYSAAVEDESEPHTQAWKQRVRLFVRDRANMHSAAPLVLLMGFNGSTPAQMRRYARLYNERECDVLAFCPTARDTYSHRQNDTVAALLWRCLCYLTSRERRPLFLHIFSGSCFTYHRMIYLARHTTQLAWLAPHIDRAVYSIAGVLMDSTPIDPRADTAATAVLSTSPRAVRQVAMLPLQGAIRTYWLLRVPQGLHQWRREFWETIHNPPNAVPQLFVYSKSDPITDWRPIEHAASQLRRRGLSAELVAFDKSPHVAHMRTDPARYAAAVDSFLKQCVGRFHEKQAPAGVSQANSMAAVTVGVAGSPHPMSRL